MPKPPSFTWIAAGLLLGPLVLIAPVRAQLRSLEILHSFAGPDGSFPRGPLLAVGGAFWGTTSSGGQFGHGTIFRISRTGELTTLYSFLGLADGASPQRLVLGPDGAVYGTTAEVRSYGSQAAIPGTLFRVAPSGALVTLFVFATHETGLAPGGLTVTRDGSMFGWTARGGPLLGGTVFRASTDGSVSLVHAFSVNGPAIPLTGDLVEGPDGNLWGTGGGYSAGNVFKVARDGTLTVVDSFSVGAYGLIAGNDGKMYGTLDHEGFPSYQTWMFSVTTSGTIATQSTKFYSTTVEFLTQTADGALFAVLAEYGILARVTSNFAYSAAVQLPGYGSRATLVDGLDGYLYGTTADGGVNNRGTVFRVSRTVRDTHPLGDIDRDGKADITVYRPWTGEWLVFGGPGQIFDWYFGQAGDVPVPANYEGALFTNLAIYRPSNGMWWVWSRFGVDLSRQWGSPGDVPVPADYDGDGNADIAVYRPSTGTWFVLRSSSNYSAWDAFGWGLADDIPVPGDYDGDGKADRAVYRPTDGRWYILESSSNNTQWAAYTWGLPGDIPVPGDYDGDGITDLAVYRPSNGTWYVATSTTGYGSWVVRQWGMSGDIPVPTDYDGDGKVDIAVYRPTLGEWFILNSSTGLPVTYLWGTPGDIPITMAPRPTNPLPH